MPENNLAPLVSELNDFVFGVAPRPVVCGRGLRIGCGQVLPEINFTLPPIDINESTWPEIRKQYADVIEQVCQRAVDLQVPGLLVEFETLPPMTARPEWGAEITRILGEPLRRFYSQYGLNNALRLTPNDNRDHNRPPQMRRGTHWESMLKLFESAAAAGADLLAIESTGGKEISDAALLDADLTALVFALGVLAPRDMAFLWTNIVRICARTGVIASGDTACGFANTAMVLAEQKMVPRVLAAIVRVASVPRSLVAYRMGAVGPSKDCAYEGPYMKAIAGVPVSMEGRTAACAHLSPVGNIAQAVCDCWSNESVQNVRLLSANAPTVSLEQLAYDTRLMNTASKNGVSAARQLRDWLVQSDAGLDPQAWVLRPDVVLKLSQLIIQESNPYRQTVAAVRGAIDELTLASKEGRLALPPRELRWLDKLRGQAETLPETEQQLLDQMPEFISPDKFLPDQYGL